MAPDRTGNAFIFPGLGLGAPLAQARSDRRHDTSRAATLAGCVTDAEVAEGLLFLSVKLPGATSRAGWKRNAAGDAGRGGTTAITDPVAYRCREHVEPVSRLRVKKRAECLCKTRSPRQRPIANVPEFRWSFFDECLAVLWSSP
jgi:hypothetical protein